MKNEMMEKMMLEAQSQVKKELEKAVNLLWAKHDQEVEKGNQHQADAFAAQAFQLLEQLPENQVYLQTRQ